MTIYDNPHTHTISIDGGKEYDIITHLLNNVQHTHTINQVTGNCAGCGITYGTIASLIGLAAYGTQNRDKGCPDCYGALREIPHNGQDAGDLYKVPHIEVACSERLCNFRTYETMKP